MKGWTPKLTKKKPQNQSKSSKDNEHKRTWAAILKLQENKHKKVELIKLTGVGWNLDKNNPNSTEPNLAKIIPEEENKTISVEEFQTIENTVPPFIPRPEAKEVKFDETNY